MDERLYRLLTASLQHTIEAWLKEQAEDGRDWPSGWVSDNLAVNMTSAAMAVFKSEQDLSAYLGREGLLAE